MRFASPIFLLILILLPAIYWFLNKRKKEKEATLLFSALELLKDINPSPRVKLAFLPKVMRYATFLLLIVALARPQAGQKNEEIYNQGIDIMMILDTSTSMRALDFRPANRLEAARKVAKEFVQGRPYDRIGIVIFSGLAYTQCPLTSDHDAVLNFIDQVEIGMAQVDGTAIGSAVATAANRLKDSTGKSRIMILVTDGRSNMGEIDPLTASQAAASMNIKIYTIGAGQPGGALYPVDDPRWGRQYVKIPEQELDEDTLAKIAETTGGRYFRATDTQSLAKIFKQIDSLEKTEIKTLKYTSYNELYGYLLWPAFLLLALELLLSNTILRRLP